MWQTQPRASISRFHGRISEAKLIAILYHINNDTNKCHYIVHVVRVTLKNQNEFISTWSQTIGCLLWKQKKLFNEICVRTNENSVNLEHTYSLLQFLEQIWILKGFERYLSFIQSSFTWMDIKKQPTFNWIKRWNVCLFISCYSYRKKSKKYPKWWSHSLFMHVNFREYGTIENGTIACSDLCSYS